MAWEPIVGGWPGVHAQEDPEESDLLAREEWLAIFPKSERSPRDFPLGPTPEGSVDIYISAGSVVGDLGDLASYQSCDQDTQGTCRIYRLRWDFTLKQGVAAEEVIGDAEVGTICTNGTGAVQPALAPKGHRLAWVLACHDTADTVSSREVQVSPVISLKVGWTGAVTNTTGLKREWPEWLDKNTLLFATNASGGTIWQAYKDPASVTGVVGEDYDGAPSDYQNPRVHTAPAYNGGIQKMVTFGDPAFAGGDTIPLVSDVDGTNQESFDLGTDSTFTECQHPAWDPEGNSVLCTRQSDAVRVAGTTGSDFDERMLQLFEPDSSTGPWSHVRELFTSPTDDTLETVMGFGTDGVTPLFPVFDRSDNTTCGARIWKFAQWCQSDEYVVATLFCTNQGMKKESGFGEGVVASRAVLIDITDSASPALYDLTRELERLLALDDGSLRGAYATCGTP